MFPGNRSSLWGVFLGLGRSLGLGASLGLLWNSCFYPHRRNSRAGSRGTSLPVADLSSSLMRWTSCPLACWKCCSPSWAPPGLCTGPTIAKPFSSLSGGFSMVAGTVGTLVRGSAVQLGPVLPAPHTVPGDCHWRWLTSLRLLGPCCCAEPLPGHPSLVAERTQAWEKGTSGPPSSNPSPVPKP